MNRKYRRKEGRSCRYCNCMSWTKERDSWANPQMLLELTVDARIVKGLEIELKQWERKAQRDRGGVGALTGEWHVIFNQ